MEEQGKSCKRNYRHCSRENGNHRGDIIRQQYEHYMRL